MAGEAADCGDVGAFLKAVVFLRYFRGLPDPRQRGWVIYPLEEVRLLCLLAVLAGAETLVDTARFGDKKRELLRRFRPFRDGTPSHDHRGDIFATLEAEHFQRCFVSWVASLTGAPAGVIASDGKTSRRSYQKKGGKDQSTWSRPSRHASASCSVRSRSRKSPMRSSLSSSSWR